MKVGSPRPPGILPPFIVRRKKIHHGAVAFTPSEHSLVAFLVYRRRPLSLEHQPWSARTYRALEAAIRLLVY
jgi:hypothetical protein